VSTGVRSSASGFSLSGHLAISQQPAQVVRTYKKCHFLVCVTDSGYGGGRICTHPDIPTDERMIVCGYSGVKLVRGACKDCPRYTPGFAHN